MAKIIDLTGQRFFRLEVISLFGKDKSGQAIWKCQCDCGNTTNVRSNSLRRGAIKSCGCWRKEKSPPNKLPFGEAPKRKLYGDYKKRAKYSNIPFEIGYDDFIKLTMRTCEYCGRFPENIIKVQYRKDDMYTYNGIDRRDNTKGYTKENCVTCCEICNRAKKDLSLEDFFAWIHRLIKYNS